MKQAFTSLTKILPQVIHGKGELSMYYSEGASRDLEVIRVNNQGRLQLIASAANLDVRVLA